MQVGAKYIHGPVKVEVVWDDEVRLVFERFDVFFVSGHHMILVAVQHIVQVIATLHLISDDATLQLDMILGIYKNLQIQEVGKLWIVEYKNHFHDHHGSGCKGEHFRCFGGIVKGVLLANNRSPALNDADILGILLKVDAVWGVEVGDPLLVNRL